LRWRIAMTAVLLCSSCWSLLWQSLHVQSPLQ